MGNTFCTWQLCSVGEICEGLMVPGLEEAHTKLLRSQLKGGDGTPRWRTVNRLSWLTLGIGEGEKLRGNNFHCLKARVR